MPPIGRDVFGRGASAAGRGPILAPKRAIRGVAAENGRLRRGASPPSRGLNGSESRARRPCASSTPPDRPVRTARGDGEQVRFGTCSRSITPRSISDATRTLGVVSTESALNELGLSPASERAVRDPVRDRHSRYGLVGQCATTAAQLRCDRTDDAVRAVKIRWRERHDTRVRPRSHLLECRLL